MFTRSTLPTLAAISLLVCGSDAGAETFDPYSLLPGWMRQTQSLSSTFALRGDLASLRDGRPDAIGPWKPPVGGLRPGPAALWPDGAASGVTGARGRLSFDPRPDDERAGSSASITLGRLNLSEPRGGAAPGGVWQSDVERELTQVRETVGRVRQVPQVSLGMRVKF